MRLDKLKTDFTNRWLQIEHIKDNMKVVSDGT